MYDLPEMGKYKGVLEMDKDIITNFENLYRAYRKAKLGKSHNGSCARFQNMSLYGYALFLAACIREMDITRLTDADYWLDYLKQAVDDNGEPLI